MEGLRRTPVHHVLHRPNLVLGGDRNLVVFSLLMSIGVALNGMTKIAVAVGAVIWFLSLFCFRKMAKADPMMRQVYMRQRKYKQFYAPRSTPWRTL